MTNGQGFSIPNTLPLVIFKSYFSFDGSTTKNEQTANYAHYLTSLGSWSNVPVIIGGWDPQNKKVEHFENGAWTVKTDFPFVTRHISAYSVANVENALFVFGKLDIIFWVRISLIFSVLPSFSYIRSFLYFACSTSTSLLGLAYFDLLTNFLLVEKYRLKYNFGLSKD